METVTLAYILLACLGGLGYWLWYWLGSGEPLMLRKASKTWVATVAACVGAFVAAPVGGPLTLLTAWGALSLGIAAARGMDWARDGLSGQGGGLAVRWLLALAILAGMLTAGAIVAPGVLAEDDPLCAVTQWGYVEQTPVVIFMCDDAGPVLRRVAPEIVEYAESLGYAFWSRRSEIR